MRGDLRLELALERTDLLIPALHDFLACVGFGYGQSVSLLSSEQVHLRQGTERTSFTSVGTGPCCVNPWKDGDKNGGATAPA